VWSVLEPRSRLGGRTGGMAPPDFLYGCFGREIAANAVTGLANPVAVGVRHPQPQRCCWPDRAGHRVDSVGSVSSWVLRGMRSGTAVVACAVRTALLGGGWSCGRSPSYRTAVDLAGGDTSCGGEAAPALWTWLATTGAGRSVCVMRSDRCRVNEGVHRLRSWSVPSCEPAALSDPLSLRRPDQADR